MERSRDRARAIRMKVLERLAGRGSISTANVAEISGLDERAARRVLSSLAELVPGVLRHRGGATFRRGMYEGTDFGAALRCQVAQKQAIARAIVRRLVSPTQHRSVFLGAGTTAYRVAESLATAEGISRLVIMTNNLAAIEALHRWAGGRARMSVCGGHVLAPTASVEGQSAAESIRRFRSDIVVASSCAISPADGSLRYRLPEQETTTHAILGSACDEVIVANDSSKFTDSAPFKFSSLRAILAAGAQRVTVVTDSALPTPEAEAFECKMREICGDAFEMVVAAVASPKRGSARKLRRDFAPRVA